MSTVSITIHNNTAQHATSAFIGQPPLTESDYWMARYMMLMYGLFNLHPDGSYGAISDPAKGVPMLPGPPPGYVHVDNVSKQVVAGSVLSAFALGMTITRLLMRGFHKKLVFGLDDWLIIPACALTVTNNLCLVYAAKRGGNGKHSWDVTYDEYKFNCKINLPCQMTMWLCLGFSKLSIAVFLRRISRHIRSWEIFSNVFIAATALWMIIITFVTLFMCGDPRYYFNPIWAGHQNKPPKCLTINNVTLGASIVHVILDFVLLGGAILLFSQTQMSKKKKLRMYALFSTALFSCSTSILRNYYEANLGQETTWTWYPFVIWIFADNNSALFVANLPVFNVLFFRADAGSQPQGSSAWKSSGRSWPSRIVQSLHVHHHSDQKPHVEEGTVVEPPQPAIGSERHYTALEREFADLDRKDSNESEGHTEDGAKTDVVSTRPSTEERERV